MTTAYSPLFNHLFTGIMLLDENFCITAANIALEQMLATSRGQILQSRIFDILQPQASDKADILPLNKQDYKPLLTQQLEQCRHLHQAIIQYDVIIHGVNMPILVDYGITPVEDEQGFFYVIELWAKDRQSRIEQEQQQHAQHQVTRQLIRSMAHEVKNPLAGILGASQLLQKNLSTSEPTTLDKSDKIQTYLSIIMDETRRLNSLVNQLLGSPKLPNWQPLNIHEPLEHVLTLIHLQNTHIELVRDYDLSLPDIVGDKDQLVQVFLNLINNAVQALTEQAEPNPCIKLRTRIVYQQTIGEIRHKSVLAVSIIDNGMGIESKLLPIIFYPLVTGRATGTGLGLALVHDIVERHQGFITVQSEKGRTEFQILLPFGMDKNDKTAYERRAGYLTK